MVDEAADVIVVGHGLAGLVVTSQIVEVGNSVLLIDRLRPTFGVNELGAGSFSVRTVDSHLYRLFRKLGVTRRAALSQALRDDKSILS